MAICKLQKKMWKHIETVVRLDGVGGAWSSTGGGWGTWSSIGGAGGGLVIHWWRWGDLVINTVYATLFAVHLFTNKHIIY